MKPYYQNQHTTIFNGDCLDVLRQLPDESVQCCVTSPPYYALRNYNVDGQIGLESSPAEYVARLVDVFREVRRVLRADGVLFLNLGDSYFGSSQTGGKNSKEGSAKRAGRMFTRASSAQRVQSCDTSGKAESDFLGCGSVSESLDGERIDALCSRTSDICLHHATILARGFCLRIQARMAELSAHLPIGGYSDPRPTMQSLTAIQDSLRSAIRESSLVLSSRLSKTPESLQQHPAGSRLSDSFSAFLSTLRSFSACAQQCVDMSDEVSEPPDGMAGNVLLFGVLAHYIQCIGEYCSLVSSYLNIRENEPQSSAILKPKDLIGIPWRVAFALQEDGWWLRQDIIWAKPNPMPESVTDRCTKAHEYIFLLSKNERYYFDHDAIREPFADERLGNPGAYKWSYANDPDLSSGIRGKGGPSIKLQTEGWNASGNVTGRNRRSVWTVSTKPYSGAHFACFPPDMIEPCILAGCPEGGTVLDPFGGSGTTAQVATEHNRKSILIELNPKYCDLAIDRNRDVVPKMALFVEAKAQAKAAGVAQESLFGE